MKMIKTLALLLALITSLHANKYDDQLMLLSPKQTTVLMDTYERAEQHNLEWTMTAIAWQESEFGKYMVGRTTPDYGTFQININTFKARYRKEIADGKLTDEDIIKMLISDYELNFTASLEELKFWYNVHGDDFQKIWASYNGGWKGNPRYARAIGHRISALKRYFNKKG